jgi:hypothetical protein
VVRLAGNNCSLIDGTLDGILRPSPNTPVSIDVIGANNIIRGIPIRGVAANGIGIRILAGANGNQIDGCRISGGGGAITGISVASNNCVVINNINSALGGGNAIVNTGAAIHWVTIIP